MIKRAEDKTTFYKNQGIFCYKKKPFRLKNTWATYHRLVDKEFDTLISRKKLGRICR